MRHYEYCYSPFDLHVLGLPLAFILSQDQTLHCKIFLHHGEPWLMSSAILARIIDVCLSNSISLVSYQSKLIRHLLFCLFPSFKERVLLPIEVTV